MYSPPESIEAMTGTQKQLHPSAAWCTKEFDCVYLQEQEGLVA